MNHLNDSFDLIFYKDMVYPNCCPHETQTVQRGRTRAQTVRELREERILLRISSGVLSQQKR